MMQWGYGAGGNAQNFGLIGSLFWIVMLVDLVLLGFWLWKQIQK